MVKGRGANASLRAVRIGCLLMVCLVNPAAADRHCSFARQSAFYARVLSAEAAQATSRNCVAKATEAFDRLNDAMAELEICTCGAAEEPLRHWLRDRSERTVGRHKDCRANAQAINAISKIVLRRVETCF